MPGVVPLASATTVLPKGLCTAFTRARTYPALLNEYPSGERQCEPLTSNSRRRWALTRRLTATELAELRTFYFAHVAQPFHLYDPYEAVPIGSNWDATGATATGRYTVRFEGGWSETTDLCRSDVPMVLVELAGTLPGAEVMNFSQPQSSGLLVL